MSKADLVPHTKILKNSKITVKEKKSQAIFLNPAREAFSIIKVDGGVVVQALASDYVVSKANVGDLVVELKGIDVDYAIGQVFATAQLWVDQGYRVGKLGALIVCARYPAFDTKLQRSIVLFKRKFSGPLHVVPRNDEFVFERVLEHTGPK